MPHELHKTLHTKKKQNKPNPQAKSHKGASTTEVPIGGKGKLNRFEADMFPYPPPPENKPGLGMASSNTLICTENNGKHLFGLSNGLRRIAWELH